MSKWYAEKGEQNDVIISTRIRLARNIDGFVYPHLLDKDGKNRINEKVKKAVFEKLGDGYSFCEMSSFTPLQAVSLAERHLISADFASRRDESGLIISDDESVSIMICEEDHVKLQVMKSGFALGGAFARADEIDDSLDSSLSFSFDERIGYLTSSPANLGTAMRASVFLHLPALTLCGQISAIASTVSKLGLSISGAYGSRKKPSGDIYQISNKITLGITEETAISNLESIVRQIANRERGAAEREIKDPSAEDKIYRAYGLLKNARLLTTEEFMSLITYVRFGAYAGLLDIPVEKIDALIIEVQPATVSVSNEDINTVTERDAKRAEIVRKALD